MGLPSADLPWAYVGLLPLMLGGVIVPQCVLYCIVSADGSITSK
jgi:hypothetical protein